MKFLTDLDIANAACLKVGIGALGEEGLDADDERTRAIAAAIDEVIEFNLELHLFSWACEVRQLSVDDLANPLTGYSKVYDLPPERIGAPLYLTDDVTRSTARVVAFALQGNQVHSSTETLFAMIRFRPAPVRWSPLFRSATISALAARLALTVREDKSLCDLLTGDAYGSPTENFRGGMMGSAIRADSYSTPALKPNWDRNPFARAWRGSDTGSED